MKQFNFRVDEENLNQLKDIAKRKRKTTGENITIADLIRNSIKEFIKNENNTKNQ